MTTRKIVKGSRCIFLKHTVTLQRNQRPCFNKINKKIIKNDLLKDQGKKPEQSGKGRA